MGLGRYQDKLVNFSLLGIPRWLFLDTFDGIFENRRIEQVTEGEAAGVLGALSMYQLVRVAYAAPVGFGLLWLGGRMSPMLNGLGAFVLMYLPVFGVLLAAAYQLLKFKGESFERPVSVHRGILRFATLTPWLAIPITAVVAWLMS